MGKNIFKFYAGKLCSYKPVHLLICLLDGDTSVTRPGYPVISVLE